MSYETIGDSYKTAIGEGKGEEFHTTLLAANTIWVFSKKYVEQKTFNWGHRVTLAGGYAVGFDINAKTWGQAKQFGPLYEEENCSENLFVLDDKIYLLVSRGFGESKFEKLFRWNAEEWENVELTKNADGTATGDPSTHIGAVVAVSTVPGVTYMVSNQGMAMRLYKLTIGESAEIEFIHQISEDIIRMGKSVSAFYTDGKVYISFGRMGCGFMWQKQSLFVYDEEEDNVTEVDVGNSDHPNGPPFSFSGATATGVTSKNDWIHAGGSTRVGMTGSTFASAVFALSGIGSSSGLNWVNLNRDFPEDNQGTAVIDSQKDLIYVVGDKVSRASLY